MAGKMRQTQPNIRGVRDRGEIQDGDIPRETSPPMLSLPLRTSPLERFRPLIPGRISTINVEGHPLWPGYMISGMRAANLLPVE